MSAEKNVFFDNARGQAVDVLTASGKSQYSGHTLETMREEYPSIELITEAEALKRTDDHARKPPKRITEGRFNEMLEILPPVDWRRGANTETFKVSEGDSGHIHPIFCRIDTTYWELHDDVRLSKEDIVNIVRKAQQSMNA